MCVQIDMTYYQRYDSLLVFLLSAHHGVAFACSSLAICKYTHVVAFKGVKQHLLSDVLVHLHLGRIVDVLRLQTCGAEIHIKRGENGLFLTA